MNSLVSHGWMASLFQGFMAHLAICRDSMRQGSHEAILARELTRNHAYTSSAGVLFIEWSIIMEMQSDTGYRTIL